MRLKYLLCAGLLAVGAQNALAGLRFQQVAGPNGADTNALAGDGSTLWAGTLRGVWKLSSGAWAFDGLSDKTVTSVTVAQGFTWAATGDGLWKRAADGTWTAEALPNNPSKIFAVVTDGTNLWAGGQGVYRRSGSTWTALASPGAIVASATLYNGDLVVGFGLQGNGAVRYSGSTVVQMSAGMGFSESPNALAVVAGTLWAGTSQGLYSWNGLSWDYQTTLAAQNVFDVRGITGAGGTLRVATFDGGIFRMNGATWTSDNAGILFASAKSFATLGGDLYVGMAGSPVYKLSGSSWVEAGSGLNAAIVSDIVESDYIAPLSAGRDVIAASHGAGATLLPTTSNLSDPGCGTVAAGIAIGGVGAPLGMIATNCGPMYGTLKSGGLSPASSGLPSGVSITALADGSTTGGGIVGGTSGAGIFRFVGSTWSSDASGLPDNSVVQSLRRVDQALLASVSSGFDPGSTLFQRKPGGTWENVSSGLPPAGTVQALGGDALVAFAGLAGGGVYRRDGTSAWRLDSAGINGASIFSIEAPLGRAFAAVGTAGVQRKQGGGWQSENSGLPSGVDARVVRQAFGTAPLFNYFPLYSSLFLGTDGHGVFSAIDLPATKVLPVVLDVVGGTGSRFRTELTIGNRNSSSWDVMIGFTPAPGFGAPAIPSGTVTRTIPAGAEMRVSDAIDFLRTAGLPIPPSGAGPIAGTLSIYSAQPSHEPFPSTVNDTLYAVARTYTSDASGSYGMAYDAPSDLDAAEEEASVYGLRSVSGASRSNLAVAHLAGRSPDPITLSVQVYSANGVAAGAPLTKTLAPGEWYQWNGILGLAGLPDGSFGYARITRTAGIGPWTSYGVVNDAATSDASFLPPYRPGGLAAARKLVVPVVLDVYGAAGSHYTTELTLVNDSPIATPADLVYQPAPDFGAAPGVPVVTLSLAAHQQMTIPDVIAYLRTKGVNVPDPATAGPQAGTLTVTFRSLTSFDAARTVALARTSTPNAAGTGSYGFFYPAAARGGGARTSAVIPALTQDATTRSNLAVVNLGGGSETAITLSVQLYDAITGAAAGNALSITLQPGDWFQWSRILDLAGATPSTTKAVAVVTRTSGDDTWLAYGVLNDAVNSDGSYIRMIPTEEY